MTDPITEDVNGFDESAYDAELDARWRDFRLRFADYLAELSVGHRFTVYDLVTDHEEATAHAEAVAVADDRLELVVASGRLADSDADRAARTALLREAGWEVHGDDTIVVGFDRRHVDAAAVAVEYAFRQVWDVPDPAYLAGEEDQTARFFTP
ncbi:TY-Chap domain-containing protein [Gordonia sp. MP11Mi]|uniref:TY-Chap N-terminal domain-containing protein n=1 Tax=Gordonia sp. MP11Mi TaxID=3022769 RepID=A0AA97GTY9_9ACTN